MREALKHTKQRVYTGLKASKNTSFGVRQEYRITFELFESLDLNNDPYCESVRYEAGDPANSPKHRPYFLLPVKEVNEYLEFDVNRYLAPE